MTNMFISLFQEIARLMNSPTWANRTPSRQAPLTAVPASPGTTLSLWIKKYKKVPTSPLKNIRAITALESGEADAYFCVTGLRDKYLMKASEKKKFRLVEIDAWAFNNLKYKKRKVYEFFNIDDDVYPGLMPSMFTGSVKSIKLSAVVVCLGEWADAHEKNSSIWLLR